MVRNTCTLTLTLTAVGISVFALACGAPPAEPDDSVEATSSATSSASKPHPKIAHGDCGCFGGFMDAQACATFAWSWDEHHKTCSTEGTAGDCAYAQNKHRGDGTGRDIYNLGVTCEAR